MIYVLFIKKTSFNPILTDLHVYVLLAHPMHFVRTKLLTIRQQSREQARAPAAETYMHGCL